MNVALCHFRVGETDGVSLEMDKWKIALEQLGHQVIYIAGSAGNCSAKIIPSLHYQHPVNNKIVANVYHCFQDYETEEELKQEIFKLAADIEKDLINCIEENKIDLIIPNNILSLGWGLSAGIAFTNTIKKTSVKALCHHHDFHWERDLYSNPKVEFASVLLEQFFPPVHERISHVCINHIAKNELKKRFGMQAKVVPNVFDFQKNIIAVDNYNRDIRNELGIKNGDIVFLQATRIVKRKAVELAIDLVSAVNEKREFFENEELYNGQVFSSRNHIYLVFAGKNEDPEYYRSLIQYANKKRVHILDISKRVSHERTSESGMKKYSLWDVYSLADMITYPSILEGWGNQFLEGIVAKLPIITYKYPVFLTDIEKFGFNVISLGSKHSERESGLVKIKKKILKEAADDSHRYLFDSSYRKEKVEGNYKKACSSLSVSSLREMLNVILKDERS